MSATAFDVTITEGQLAESDARSGQAYSQLPVPNDYPLVVASAEDWKDKETGAHRGVVYQIEIDQESAVGAGLSFKYWIDFDPEYRNKMIRFLKAVGQDVLPGEKLRVFPEEHVGAKLAGRIDFPRKFYKAQQDSPEAVMALGPVFREIRYVFPRAEMPVVDFDTADPYTSVPQDVNAPELVGEPVATLA